MPRPKLDPTPEQRQMVKTVAAMGGKQEEIARRIGIKSEKTLRKYFRDDIDQGVSEANLSVAQAIFKKAKAGDVIAAMFWLKCRANWRDKNGPETPSGPPPPFIVASEPGGPDDDKT